MDKYGLLGRKLGHSYSPQIHAMLYEEPYGLYETEPENLEAFLRDTELRGMNVTIPYKKAVLPYCAELSRRCRRIGGANTLLRRHDGWYADNTDYDGFTWMLRRLAFSPGGKKALVLGSGGASAAVRAVLEDLGAGEIVTVSRSGPDNYENLEKHADAALIVNATPVGMAPECGFSPVDLHLFPRCEAVCDLIYNPARTALLLQAEELGIPRENGLGMLAAQAVRSAELFTGKHFESEKPEEIRALLERQTRNIVLIGMPGCGKSAVARNIAWDSGRTFRDSDKGVVMEAGMSIPEIFDTEGEAGFRARETAELERLGKQSGLVIATGGGCVTRPENYSLLHQNGVIVWLRRDLESLSTQGRPLSQTHSAQELYSRRKDLYAAFADIVIDNNGTIIDTVRIIEEALL